jgi:hypothetical protein
MRTYPRLMPRTTLLLHRHYNSPKPDRKVEFDMYAVLKNDTSAMRYLEMAGLAKCGVRVPNPVAYSATELGFDFCGL